MARNMFVQIADSQTNVEYEREYIVVGQNQKREPICYSSTWCIYSISTYWDKSYGMKEIGVCKSFVTSLMKGKWSVYYVWKKRYQPHSTYALRHHRRSLCIHLVFWWWHGDVGSWGCVRSWGSVPHLAVLPSLHLPPTLNHNHPWLTGTSADDRSKTREKENLNGSWNIFVVLLSLWVIYLLWSIVTKSFPLLMSVISTAFRDRR